MDYGDIFRLVREYKELSRGELAKMLDTDENFIETIEELGMMPPPKLVDKMSELFNIPSEIIKTYSLEPYDFHSDLVRDSLFPHLKRTLNDILIEYLKPD